MSACAMESPPNHQRVTAMERPPRKEPVVPPSTFVAPSREELVKDVQGFIVLAFEARTEYIRQEDNIMTLASFRRILEKDLKVESGFLETYKEFVTGLIKELLEGPEEDSAEVGKVIDEPAEAKEKVIEEPEAKTESEGIEEDPKPQMKRLKRKADSEEVKHEVMVPVGVVSEPEEKEEPAKEEELEQIDIEGMIGDAAQKRAFQFKAEAETLTIKKVRRLLEQDLEFEIGALDAYKVGEKRRWPTNIMYKGAVIRLATFKEILNSENPENPVSTENEESAHISYCEVPETKKKQRKAAAPESTKKPRKKRKRFSGGELVKSSSSSCVETPKVRNGRKGKKKVVQQEDEVASEKDNSSVDEADDEMPERRKTKPVESKPVNSKKVEHLKNIIKDCGITLPLSVVKKANRAGVARRAAYLFLKVPPSVYKKAKQAGESRRDGIMITELEAILAKEGLTASASRDEIKAVRKRKAKLKDMDGIDTGNIIEEARGRRLRRSANFFIPPRRDQPIDLGDEDEDEDVDDNSEGDPNVELQDDDDEED